MNSLKSINKYFLKYKWRLLSGALFVILSTVFSLYQGVIVRKATNEIVDLIAFKKEIDSFLFLKFGLILIALALTSGLFMYLMRQTIIVMSRHIEFDQKNELFQHYQVSDAAFYKNNSTGDLMNRISEDVSKVRMYTGPAIMYLINTFATVVIVLVFMIQINWQLTLIVFIPLPFLSFLIYKVSDLINKRSNMVQQELSVLTSHAQESFSAIRIIKSFTREDFYSSKLEKLNQNYKSKYLKLSMIEAVFQPVMVLMIGISVIITVWIGGRFVVKGVIEPGNINEFILYVYFLFHRN
jgi:ATP-binding cassette subfamily B protein